MLAYQIFRAYKKTTKGQKILRFSKILSNGTENAKKLCYTSSVKQNKGNKELQKVADLKKISNAKQKHKNMCYNENVEQDNKKNLQRGI